MEDQIPDSLISRLELDGRTEVRAGGVSKAPTKVAWKAAQDGQWLGRSFGMIGASV